MSRKSYIDMLRHGIDQIDMAVAQGRASGYRICNTQNPVDPNAEFWGVDNTGQQLFGTSRNLLTMVVFPSEKLAKRCLSMTGGYVLSVAHILAAQRNTMERRLKELTKLEELK